MRTPESHHENKLEVLRLLRDNYRHYQVAGTRLGLDLDVVEASTGLSSSELRAIMGELVAIDLATPQPSTSRPVAVRDGRIEITAEGLTYLHNVETSRAHEIFRVRIAQEAAAEQRADIREETRRSNLEPDEYRSGQAGFHFAE